MRLLALPRSARRDPAQGQGVRAGSLYLLLGVGAAGVLTYLFQFVSGRALGPERYGVLMVLWSATFLTAQVLWTGVTQVLGKHIAEREARGERWEQVFAGARRLQIVLALVFLAASALGGRVLAGFFGDPFIAAAFVAAVAGYALSYFRRGVLSGHRQFARLSGVFVLEAGSRFLIAAALLLAGWGTLGPAAGIALAPLVSVLFIRPAGVSRPETQGEPFDMAGALRFAGPVLVCQACAQVLANGGPLLITGIGGADAAAQAGLLGAGLILTRAPQYVLSPAISNLLPHLSRFVAQGDEAGFDRFVARAVGAMVLMGGAIVGGAALFGELAIGLFGRGFRLERGLLVVLAVVAAAYLVSELLNQALFARNLPRLAAACWLLGVAVTGAATWLLRTGLLERVAYALALGTAATAVALAAAHMAARRRAPLSRHAGLLHEHAAGDGGA